ncbi:periplasmic heavy metal sensor [Pseudomonas sp. MYb185]|uniref:periplasmic heavy metal sensor n=1 Tax=Pseudomonas sp. MYb185 TaxID=1848729 RepID=UPI000CFD5BC5|nr:periplasmic heavy metal sensor [Pseudomonas sp. MYb185]PRB80605.1 hypothetical protein CQ007_12880 [Pseudomonas sp. MYb185]
MKKILIAGLFALTTATAGAALAAPDAAEMGKHHQKHLERLASELQLTAEQQEQLRAVHTEQFEKMKALRDEKQQKVDAILTDEQRTKLQELRDNRREKMKKHMQERHERKGRPHRGERAAADKADAKSN